MNFAPFFFFFFRITNTTRLKVNGCKDERKGWWEKGTGGGVHSRESPLGAVRRVADGVQDTASQPAQAQTGGEEGVSQARDEQVRHERGHVLCEVGVCALGCFCLCVSLI